MKMRLTGTEKEIDKFVEDLKIYYDVISASSFYSNTRKVKESKDGRCYCDIRLYYIDENGNQVFI